MRSPDAASPIHDPNIVELFRQRREPVDQGQLTSTLSAIDRNAESVATHRGFRFLQAFECVFDLIETASGIPPRASIEVLQIFGDPILSLLYRFAPEQVDAARVEIRFGNRIVGVFCDCFGI